MGWPTALAWGMPHSGITGITHTCLGVGRFSTHLPLPMSPTIQQPLNKGSTYQWEALALNRVLLPHSDSLRNMQVGALVDNRAIVHVWHRQGGRNVSLNGAIKRYFLPQWNWIYPFDWCTSPPQKIRRMLHHGWFLLLIVHSILIYGKTCNANSVAKLVIHAISWLWTLMPWSICRETSYHILLIIPHQLLWVWMYSHKIYHVEFLSWNFPCVSSTLWLVRYYIYSRLITARAPWLPWIYIHWSTGGHSTCGPRRQ